MSHSYLEYQFTVEPLQPGTEILLAELSLLPFESFEETGEGLKAYIRSEDWEATLLDELQLLQNKSFQISHQLREIPIENWNERWETNFTPIQVGSKCVVRAPFHEVPNVLYDIVIEPKMSFGTGHHETTHMMLLYILKLEMAGKSVLDMGCGTAVLAILSSMKGASDVEGIDIDHWSYVNAKENVVRNKQERIVIYEGDSTVIPRKKYDVLIANINRNCLLQDLPVYKEHLQENGTMLLSGFYEKDEPLISKKARELGLSLQEKIMRNDWVATRYQR
ncbi:MAG: 50S ribosomal protein L11 methyltransferase [Eudoraea sp.]|nr:50S ribosomal protein L11 methyltransferase [Eudoraea sp.]